MNQDSEPTTASRTRHRRWYPLGVIGVAVGLLGAVGLACFEKINEASARSK
jgi:hypothetical protein